MNLELVAVLIRLIIFGTIGLLILIIACINYMNMATSRSVNRWKEVSIRKTLGASKGILIKQFLVESLIIALIAHILAMFFVEFFLPHFSNYTDNDIHLIYSDHRIVLYVTYRYFYYRDCYWNLPGSLSFKSEFGLWNHQCTQGKEIGYFGEKCPGCISVYRFNYLDYSYRNSFQTIAFYEKPAAWV